MGIRSWNYQQEQVMKKLRNYRALVSKHKVCKDLMDSLYPSTIQNITDMPKGCGEDLRMESLIDRRASMHCQMQDSLRAMQEEIGTILDLIKPLPANEYTVITRYFLLGETMEMVSERTNWSLSSCWRYRNKAISRLSAKMTLFDTVTG